MNISDLTVGDEVKLGPRPAVQPFTEDDMFPSSVHRSFADATGIVELIDQEDGCVCVRVDSNPDIWPRGLTQWLHHTHIVGKA